MAEGTSRPFDRALPGPCIWPGCRKSTYASSSQNLCPLHVSTVLAQHQEHVNRINREAEADESIWYAENPRSRRARIMRAPREAVKPRDTETPRRSLGDPIPGWVYYLRIGGHYKIGWAKHLNDRLRSYPPDGQVLATHPGTRAEEGAIHRRFAHLTTAGREWYPLVPDISRHIQLVVEEHGQPDPDLRCGPKPTEVKRPQHFRNGPGARNWNGGRRAS